MRDKCSGTLPRGTRETWRTDKTVGSLALYDQASRHRVLCKNQEEETILQKIMEEIKQGTRVIHRYFTDEEFLTFLEEVKLFARNRT